MATVTSNMGDVAAWLMKAVTALDCTDLATAEALAAPIREGIAARAGSLSGPGGQWAENVGQYKIAKDRKGLAVGTGLKNEQPRMLDADQLAGEILKAGPVGFSLAYGTDPDVKARGQWFHNGSGSAEDGTSSSAASGQAARPFWAATAEDEAKVAEVARRIIDQHSG
jgi:hypothetical protein